MEILYRDDYLVAVNKPPGLLVHRSPLDPHETRFALQMVRDALKQRVYPAHRLDRGTSGVLLFSLSALAARHMAAKMEERLVTKHYVAVVRGVTDAEGIVDHPLAEGESEPREAVTLYRRLSTVELPFSVGRYPTARYSLLEVSPISGRRHQLRRHLKHLFHPIIGDTTYGEGRHNRFFREELGCTRMLLHAARVSFRHPITDLDVTVAAPFDGQFSRLLDQLGWREKFAPPEQPLPKYPCHPLEKE